MHAHPITACALSLLALGLVAPHANAQAMRFEIDRERSSVYAVTGRAGALGFLGHDHAILATEWSGRLCYAQDDPAASSIQVTVPTRALVLDTDAAMEASGLSSRPGTDTRQDLQSQMLGPAFLDAVAYPEISFTSHAVTPGEDGELMVDGAFTLHGEARDARVPVRVSRNVDGTWRFRASLTTHMTEHGIEPESTLGVIDVADAFDVFVEIVARAEGEACG
ncbi:MAG: YceI family protein [Trueperaceae bacterium]|nr:YceI family protein [Trueperaceae bacterium]